AGDAPRPVRSPVPVRRRRQQCRLRVARPGLACASGPATAGRVPGPRARCRARVPPAGGVRRRPRRRGRGGWPRGGRDPGGRRRRRRDRHHRRRRGRAPRPPRRRGHRVAARGPGPRTRSARPQPPTPDRRRIGAPMSTTAPDHRDDTRSPHPRRGRWVVVALLLLPTLLLGGLLVSLHDPGRQLDRVTVALVNEDEPVEVEGQLTPLGRLLTADLAGSDDPSINWVLCNGEDAAEGLESGEYGSVVTIPEDFSADATSVASTDPAQVRQAAIDVVVAPDTPVVDVAITTEIYEAARDSLSTMVTTTFLDNIYLSFDTMHDQLGEAADGSSALADGTAQLRDGTVEARAGTGQLAA